MLSNKPPEGGYPAFDPSETLPVWLDREGYETAHFGKYLNHYLKDDEVPPGWDRWFGVVEPASRYFKVHVNDQGTLTKFGGKDPDLYSTDLFTDRAVEFIEEREGEPFYMSIGYVAPHVGKSFQEFGHCDEKGPEPAPRHLGMFDEKEIPRGPAFNEKDVTDKPSDVQDRGKVSGLVLAQKTDKYQCRLEALQSVDEGVGQLVDALRDAGELNDTYIIFVSDNGFIQGEHRIEGGKAVPYESAIHIPMIVRGPGVAKGKVAPALISNVDVVPTLLELTGAEPELVQDGRSFLKNLRRPSKLDGRAVLIESRYQPQNFTGVRTNRFLYVERETGETELYDLRRDPDQLENIRIDPFYSAARETLADLLDRLRVCEGGACSALPALELEVRRSAERAACRTGRAEVAIHGSDAGLLRGTRIAGSGRDRVFRGDGPWRVDLSGKEVVADAELVDGRIMRLSAPAGKCE